MDKEKDVFDIKDSIELIHKRTLNEKHYLNKDGTITAALYKEQIHNLKDGKYIEIDKNTSRANNLPIAVQDTSISSNPLFQPQGDEEVLLTGLNDDDTIFRSLFKFNLPTIGTGSQVVDARGHLIGDADDEFIYGHGLVPDQIIKPDEYVIDVHEITTSWNEATARWESMHDRFDSRVEDNTIAQRTLANEDYGIVRLGRTSFNITNLVKRWYSGKPNYGVMLKAHEEVVLTNGKIARFISKDNSVSDDVAPMLYVRYRNMNGLLNHMSYQDIGFSHGSAHVNHNTGNLTTIFNLGNTIGAQIPANLELIYNTNDVILNNNYQNIGNGYKFNYYQTIAENEDNDTKILIYLNETGTIYYFYPDSEEENIYHDRDGLDLTIIKEENWYLMKDKTGNEYFFSRITDKWHLVEIKDLSNNILQIIYQNNQFTDEIELSRIIDSSNNAIEIEYSRQNVMITTPNKQNSLVLTSVGVSNININPDTIRLSYNENNLISRINDITGLSTSFDYYQEVPYRIQKITEYGLNDTLGTDISFQYGFDSTTITDNKGRNNTYTFNPNGATISITDLDENVDVYQAFGQSDIFGSQSGATNKLTTNNILLEHVHNYIMNPSFENETVPYFGGNVTISNEYARTGTKSVHFNGETISETIKVSTKKSYTFSIYTKLMQGSINLSLSYQKENGEVKVVNQNFARQIDDFVRCTITIHISEDDVSASDINLELKISSNELTNAYLDDFQLEENETANFLNLVDNSNFSNQLDTWKIESPSPTDSEIITLENGNKALKFNNKLSKEIVLEKVFNINGKKGDIYNLSFWYKNEGILSTYKPNPFSGANTFCFIRFISTDDESGLGVPSTPLNFNNTQWQFFSQTFQAQHDYSNLELIIMSINDSNHLYLTNFSLFKDLAHNNYSYDEQGNMILASNWNQSSDLLNYNQNNQLMSMTQPNNSFFRFEHDNIIHDRLLSAKSIMGLTNKIRYDQFGNPTTTRVFNANDEENRFEIRVASTDRYLQADFIKRTISDLSQSCSRQNWLLQIKDNQVIIQSGINSRFYLNLLGGEVRLGTDEQPIFIIDYNENGSISFRAIQEHLFLSIYENELILSEIASEFFLESANNKLFIENNAHYTKDGRFIKSTTDSLGNKAEFDINQRNGLTNSLTDAKGIKTTYEYDERERLIKVQKEDQVVNYEYNNQHLLSKIKHGTKEYNFNYNDFLNSDSISIGNNKLIENNYEERNGNLISSTYGNNHVINYQYDKQDRITNINKMNDNYQIIYNNLNQISKIISNNDIYHYKYDFANRLDSLKTNELFINYNYDISNNITRKFTDLDNQQTQITNYSYNLDNAVEQIEFDNEVIKYDYDYLGRIRKTLIDNNYHEEFDYVSQGNRTSELINKIISQEGTLSYEYDELENITHIYQNNELINQYFYDNYNQLIKEENYKTNELVEYSYDNIGNIITKRYFDLTTKDAVNEDTYEYGNQEWEDQLTRFNNEKITYDEIGNPIKIGGNKILEWINGRQLKNYQDGKINVSYEYNHEGIRTKKIINNIHTIYHLEGSQIIFEKTVNDVIYYIRDNDGELLGLKHNNSLYYYQKNIQGDIVGILDKDLKLVTKYQYDSWGNIISIIEEDGNDISNQANHIGNINSFRYRSYYYDKETNLYYLNSRYYNPIWGRFLNADRILGANDDIISQNLYAYCSNNPTTYYDPEGDLKLWAIIRGGKKLARAVSVKVAPRAAVASAGPAAPVIHQAAKRAPNLTPLTKNSHKISQGFNSFSPAKKNIGSPGVGNQWHHIVEQSQIQKSGFDPTRIHRFSNMFPLDEKVHQKISAHYNSIPDNRLLTNGLRVRDWLAGQDIQTQYEYGIKIIEMFIR